MRTSGAFARHLLLGTSALAMAIGAARPALAQATGPINTGPGTFTGDFVNSGTTPGVLVNNSAVVNGNFFNPAGATLAPGIFNPALKNHTNFTGAGVAIIGATVNGGISNGGVISVSSASNGALPAGIGIQALFTNVIGLMTFVGAAAALTGGITNTGTITVTAHQGGGAVGVADFANTFGGGFTNTGLIAATGIGAGAGGVEELLEFGSSIGNIFNSGTISATGMSSGGDFSDIKGTYQGFTNTGLLSASDGSASSIVLGVHLDSTVTLAQGVTNSGTIQLTSSGTPNPSGNLAADVQGIEIIGGGVGTISGHAFNFNPTIGGGVLNSGVLSVLSSATPGGATGIIITGGVTIAGSVSNSGLIAVSAVGGVFTPSFSGLQPVNQGAIGIAVGGQVAGALTAVGSLTPSIAGGINNSGLITVLSANGFARGIDIVGLVAISGGINNSGTIIAQTGIRVATTAGATIAGGINNTGMIIGSTAAIDLSTAIGANVINQQAGAITGTVKLSAFGDTFNISGGVVTGSVTGGLGAVPAAVTAGAGGLNALPLSGGAVNLTGGSLVLGTTNSITNVTSFSQTGGGTLVMQVTSNTAVHPSVSASTVTIGTGSVFEAAELGGGFAKKETYADVVVSGVSFADNFTVTSLSPLFQASLVPDPTTANALDLVLNFSSLCALNGLTFNQHSAGCRVDALTNVATDPATTAFLGAIANDPNLAGALDNVSGSQHPQTNYATVQDTQTALDLVLNHLAGGGISSFVTGANFSRNGLRFASLDGGSDTPSQLAQAPGGSGSPYSLWVTGYGSFANASDTVDALGFSASTGGALAALEYDAGNGLLLGGAFDYAHSSIAFNDGTGSSGINQYLFMPYARWSMDNWYASGVGAIGWDNIDTNRIVSLPGFGASSSTSHSGLSYGVRGEFGYDFHCEPGWTLTPVGRLSFAGLSTDAFTESGGPASLIVNSQTSQSLTSAIGGRVTTKFDLGGAGYLTPEVHAFWQHEFLDAQDQVTAAFVGAPSGEFVTLGSNFGRDSGLVGLAVSTDPTASTRFSLTYDAQISGNFTSHTFSAAFHAKF